MLRFLSSKVSLSLRIRLVEHFTKLYLKGKSFYSINNVDDRVKNPDQIITGVIKDWSKSFSYLFSDITKPVFDISIFTYKLAGYLGIKSPLYILLWYGICGSFIRLISPSFGKMTVISHRLEGNFNKMHNKNVTHCEEIAFYDGHLREKGLLEDSFNEVRQHKFRVFEKQFYMGIVNQFLTKYGSTLVGYSVLGLPILSRTVDKTLNKDEETSVLARDYIRNSSLLISLSGAVGRIISCYKDVQRLSGHTIVLEELESVLNDMNKGIYHRKMIDEKMLKENDWRLGKGEITEVEDFIEFENVPVIAPNGDLILKRPLSFKIEKGDHLMVLGPNGSGKSSAFRILRGLWPIFGGKLSCPSNKSVAFLSQRPYLTVGTLRDQVIYPQTKGKFRAKGGNDDELGSFMDNVKLQHILERHGWDSKKEWYDVLSGGEKQRLAIARLYYNKPTFAFLDESTSAVSADVEESLYDRCKELGITIVTISHRTSLKKFHKFSLSITDDSSWEFDSINN